MGRKRHACGEAGSDTAAFEQAGDPLLCALFEGDVDGARALIEGNNCSIDAADHMGWQPLHRAAFGGFGDILGLLIERRADATAADTDGLQPLHIAAAGGHADCCRRLVAARADPTASESFSGMTPQMYTMTKDGALGTELQEILGAPDLGFWAAEDDPVALAMHIAATGSDEQKSALDEHLANHTGISYVELADLEKTAEDSVFVCRPCPESDSVMDAARADIEREEADTTADAERADADIANPMAVAVDEAKAGRHKAHKPNPTDAAE